MPRIVPWEQSKYLTSDEKQTCYFEYVFHKPAKLSLTDNMIYISDPTFIDHLEEHRRPRLVNYIIANLDLDRFQLDQVDASGCLIHPTFMTNSADIHRIVFTYDLNVMYAAQILDTELDYIQITQQMRTPPISFTQLDEATHHQLLPELVQMILEFDHRLISQKPRSGQ